MDPELTLGETIDPAERERTGTPLAVDASDLTTHGVIVGMTGSGKTGLGVVLIEEALRAGIPTLVLDPKGDMTNLALRFPGLSSEEFAPWVAPGADAAATATTWREGLAGWGLDGTHIAELDERSDVTVYTPGSTAGVAMDLVGSLSAPPDADEEAQADEIDGLVSGLLSMVGITADAKQHELVAAAGDLLGSFLGGRRSARSIVSKVKGVSSRRKQTSAAGQRLETALAGVEAKTLELADLEAELVDELAEIEAEWADVADQVEEVEVGLEKNDIDVRQLALIWVPA